jgi:hypothetical protein
MSANCQIVSTERRHQVISSADPKVTVDPVQIAATCHDGLPSAKIATEIGIEEGTVYRAARRPPKTMANSTPQTLCSQQPFELLSDPSQRFLFRAPFSAERVLLEVRLSPQALASFGISDQSTFTIWGHNEVLFEDFKPHACLLEIGRSQVFDLG